MRRCEAAALAQSDEHQASLGAGPPPKRRPYRRPVRASQHPSRRPAVSTTPAPHRLADRPSPSSWPHAAPSSGLHGPSGRFGLGPAQGRTASPDRPLRPFPYWRNLLYSPPDAEQTPSPGHLEPIPASSAVPNPVSATPQAVTALGGWEEVACCFTSPITRMLLITDGLTTTLLQALVGEKVTAHVHEVRRLSGSQVVPATRTALGGSARDKFLMRRTHLVLPWGEVLSDNTVIARLGVERAVEKVVTDCSVPLGFGLGRAGLLAGRKILSLGTAAWTAARQTAVCASKVYVLNTPGAGGPMLCVRERFHPRHVPPMAVELDGVPVPRTPLLTLPDEDCAAATQ